MNGRKPDGTFAPGNTAAANRRSKPAELRRALEAAVSPEHITKLAESLLRMANAGDVSAAKLLCDRLIPRISFEEEVAARLAEWKEQFIHELLYATDADYLRREIVGNRVSGPKQASRILELLNNLESFRE